MIESARFNHDVLVYSLSHCSKMKKSLLLLSLSSNSFTDFSEAMKALQKPLHSVATMQKSFSKHGDSARQKWCDEDWRSTLLDP